MARAPTSNELWQQGFFADDLQHEHEGNWLFCREDREEDNRKMSFRCWVAATETWVDMDFSPYSYVSKSSFIMWLRLGQPDRRFFGMLAPPNDETYRALEVLMQRHNIPAGDQAASLRVRTLISLLGRGWYREMLDQTAV